MARRSSAFIRISISPRRIEHHSLCSAMGMPHSLQTRIRGFAGSRFIPNRRFSNDMRPPKVPTVANTLDGTSGFLVDSVFGWLASGRHLDEPRLEAGKRLDETYKLAWMRGLKTTYYLRTLAATSAEKSTGRGGELNAVPESGTVAALASPGRARHAAPPEPEPKFCAIDDPTCEACQ